MNNLKQKAEQINEDLNGSFDLSLADSNQKIYTSSTSKEEEMSIP